MPLPTDLLQAIAAPGGGKIALVVGAGCSFEAPTSIPLAGTCSQECHDRLVVDNVISTGDCPAPWDLSCLADTVVKKTGDQKALVEQLCQHYPLKTATPNEGHLLTAALLREGALAAVMTLNFDLAFSTALCDLGVELQVGIIDGPDDLPSQKAINLFYLHRNATTPDPEAWILRTDAMKTEWKGRWESVITAKVLSTPVVLFAGLGSPADVLIESTRLIKKAIPNASKTYQIDPVDRTKSKFFEALALDPSAYLQATWCDFMAALSERLVHEHTTRLQSAASTVSQQNQFNLEDITALLARFKEIGLLKVGHLRANWLLHDKPYLPDEQMSRDLIADLLLAAALMGRLANATPILFDDGIVEFRRGDQTVASLVFVSGRGSRTRIAIETALSTRQRRFRGRASPPNGAVLAGTIANPSVPVTVPRDVILGDTSDNIVMGQISLPVFHVDSIRQDDTVAARIVP